MIDWSKTKETFGEVDLGSYRPKVYVKCDECGKSSIFTVRVKSRIKSNNIDWLCQRCVGKKNSNILSKRTKKLWRNKGYKNKRSEYSKKLWKNEEYVAKIKSNKNDFINKSKVIHNNKYDYSKTNYTNSNIKVKICCPIHGEFEQLPSNHLTGHGCPDCADTCLDTQEFIKRSKIIHNDKYDYSKTNYVNSYTKVTILCPTHGEFEQLPISHYNGNGCPLCAMLVSSGHQELIDFIKVNKIINDRDTITPYELDIYLPDFKIGIEYHGLYYHSYDKLESKKEKFKHYRKADLCAQKGIQLLQVFEDEWIFKKGIVKSMINAKLGLSKRIYARNCTIRELSNTEFNGFCNYNHIQGAYSTRVRLGLENGGKIVCVMGFNRKKEYYECTRFCNIINHTIIGGASKLFKYFRLKYKPSKIMTYADRRYSNGNLYKTLGFEFIKNTNPGYFYIKNNSRFNRSKFQKHKLNKMLINFNESLSESANMFNNGYRRIWDAGHTRLEW